LVGIFEQPPAPDKYSMTRKCCSQNRCALKTCAPCSRRYAKHIARRIQSTGTHKLYAVEIDIALLSPAGFWSWRVEVRNVIDYRRRTNRWWRNCGLNVWLGADQRLRGIVFLGPVAPVDFLAAFSRWQTTLRPVDPTVLRETIYSIVRPGMIATMPTSEARYQSLKLAVWPRRKAIKTRSLVQERAPTVYIEPMPVLI
jgi:hypothetical protein